MAITSPSQVAEAPARRESSTAPGLGFRLGAVRVPVVEAAVSVAAALWMLISTKTITNFAPLDATSQTAGLSSLQVRLFAPGMALVVLLLAVQSPRLARFRSWAPRIAFSALPGLVSGFIGAGVMLALRGTNLPLNGVYGDAGDMERWAQMLQRGQMTHPGYPPLFPRMVWFTALFTHHNVFTAYKYDEILMTALLGPATYLAWRLVTGKTWASVLAVALSATLAAPYKCYEPMVLLVMMPISIAFLRYVRDCEKQSYRRLVAVSALAGLSIGELFILFSGPFYWMAAGIGICMVAVFPWRSKAGRLKGLTVLGVTGVAFLIPAGQLLLGLLDEAPDPYFFWGTSQDPAYMLIEVTDLPGPLANGVWPVPGEVGGVGVYGLLVLALAGVAFWLGIKRMPVMFTIATLAGAWLLRFHLASMQYRDHLVRYWTRATTLVIAAFIILAVFAVKYAAERVAATIADLRDSRTPEGAENRSEPATRARALRRSTVGLAALCFSLTVFSGMAGSAMAWKLMPRQDGSPGQLSWNAHHVKETDLVQMDTKVNGK